MIEIEYRDAEEVASEAAADLERIAKRRGRREEGWVLTEAMARRVVARAIEDDRAALLQAAKSALAQASHEADAAVEAKVDQIDALIAQLTAHSQELRDAVEGDEPEPAG